MEETGQLEGMSRREKRKLRKQKEKDALARIEEQDEYDAQSSQEILDRRNAGRKQADFAKDQMEAKEEYISKRQVSSDLTEEEQKSTGVTSDLIRLSVGLESVTDLKADLEQAFKTI